MKSILKTLFFVILFTSYLFGQDLIDFEARLSDFNFDKISAIDDSAALDSFIVAKMEEYHFPGLAACIVKDDKIIWKGNYGYADIGQNKLVNDSTLFHIASASKPFTGTALLQLWEEGLFDLDDDINDYLPFEVRNPFYPNEPITFRMLLTHTSSMGHHPDLLISYISTQDADCSVGLDSFLVNYLLPEGNYYWMNPFLNRSPGSYYNYTTAGFALLGYLVENIADTSYEEYCQEKIFIPLGMNHTSWFLENLNTNNLAKQYTYSSGAFHTSPYMGRPDYPGVMLKSSTSQLARFLIAFIQKGIVDDIRILNSTTVDSMTTIQFPPDMGFSWFIDNYFLPNSGERTICAHLGGVTGVNSLIGYIMGTGENVGGVILTNRRNDTGILEIAFELLSYGIITNVEKEKIDFPKDFFLSQNYPNPFNPTTSIEFTLPKSAYVELKVYNILGKVVSILVSKKLNQGTHTYKFDGSNLASGVYYYRIEAGNFVQTRKMVYLK